jgi:hypothetical protein
MDDATLLRRAEEFHAEKRLLNAAAELRQVKDHENLFTDRHKMMLRWAELVESGIEKMLQDPEKDGSPWIKQNERHGHRNFLVFYQVTEENQLIARIDCAFESSLLVPLLAVFNESELYASWMPSWKKPIKLGVTKSEKLKEEGPGNQIIHVRTALTWPFCDRDLIMRVMAVDAIEDNQGCIAIQALNQTSEDDPVIPEATNKTVELDFSNFLLIRACPSNHPCVTRSEHRGVEDHEPLILLSMSLEVDPHISAVPQSAQNFITRTVLGRMWLALLHVAEDVRDGKRPMHKEAIDAKRDLYDWIEERVGVMIKNLEMETAPIRSS